MGWARRAWEHRLERREAGRGVEGHNPGCAVEGIAGRVEVGHMVVVAVVTGNTRDGQAERHMEPVVEVKVRRSIPAAAAAEEEEEAGHSRAAGEDSDPGGEGHHGEHPEEDRIVAEDTEAVDSPVEDREEALPEDIRRAVVLCQMTRLVFVGGKYPASRRIRASSG